MYPSRFFKAESRAAASQWEAGAYRASYDDKIIVEDLFVPAGKTVPLQVQVAFQHLLMPVAGGALLTLSNGAELALQPGEVYRLGSDMATLDITNVYGEETINLLHISLRDEAIQEAALAAISLDAKNQLTRGRHSAGMITAGVYDSRTKDVYRQQHADATVFVFVINGSFEMEDRLMEFRDGLALWGNTPIEFEALAEAAIILFIEHPDN